MAKKDILSLSSTEEFLKTVGGNQAPELVKICLKKDKNISDEEIGKSLPLKITEIRTILNRLHYRGIACYNKRKGKRSGWYSYTWMIKSKRIAELIMEQHAEKVEKLEKALLYQQNYAMFSCKNKCITTPFEVAVEYQFKCPECGETMNAVNKRKSVKEIEKEIKDIKKEIKVLEKET